MSLNKENRPILVIHHNHIQFEPPRKATEIRNYLTGFPIYSFSHVVLLSNDYFSVLIAYF